MPFTRVRPTIVTSILLFKICLLFTTRLYLGDGTKLRYLTFFSLSLGYLFYSVFSSVFNNVSKSLYSLWFITFAQFYFLSITT